ncbi:hypothetical protein Y1Q_0018634 [Alligator mississippiensis]|uniref:Uncharacterized protein n=1 Tax=Alligator mississippiensis TaxID=8496 RepID=A0A151NRQ7_ALLMI|nr:hypothetical protein Y1Q_0018634 [Alligator mississippiensis]
MKAAWEQVGNTSVHELKVRKGWGPEGPVNSLFQRKWRIFLSLKAFCDQDYMHFWKYVLPWLEHEICYTGPTPLTATGTRCFGGRRRRSQLTDFAGVSFDVSARGELECLKADLFQQLMIRSTIYTWNTSRRKSRGPPLFLLRHMLNLLTHSGIWRYPG